ncbi:MFS transporter [Nocardia sp. IFM 10818]
MSSISTADARSQMRRVVASSFTGSLIEYYDFMLYSTASAVVFGKVFFSNLDGLTATIASFATFAAGYLARPLGGIVFGHFGDRLGRKKMLVLTMTLMAGVSTVIGLLPTYAAIGFWAPVLLTLLRVVQGIAVGGEWGGAVLMTAEHATSRRGLWASFTNAGAPAGLVLSTAVMSATAGLTTDAQFLSWGWRIPFLLSLGLLAVGLYIRLSVRETPAFEQLHEAGHDRGFPLLEVLRDHWRNLLLTVGVGLGAFIAQGTLTTFVVAYAVNVGFARPSVLNALTIASAFSVVLIPLWAGLTDRVGRRPVILAGAVSMGLFAFALFPMIRTGSWPMLLIALVLGVGILHPAWYGPLAALCSEMFSTSSRYTGASLGYQLAGIGAGVAPLVFTSMQKSFDNNTIGVSLIVAAFALLSVICVLAISETRHRDLAEPIAAENEFERQTL